MIPADHEKLKRQDVAVVAFCWGMLAGVLVAWLSHL